MSVEASDIIDIDFNPMSGATKSVAVTVKNPSQAASGNANLSSLKVSAGSLSPSFSPNTTSYTVNVANSVTTCTMTATKADPNATLSVSGSASLSAVSYTHLIPPSPPLQRLGIYLSLGEVLKWLKRTVC